MTDLPSGWAKAPLSELIAHDGIFTDGDWVESKDQDPNGAVRLIQLADIADSHFVNKSSRYLTREKADELNCTFLKKGDLLVARMPDPLGRCCVFPLDGDERFVTVVDVCAIRLGSASIEPRYVMRAINSPEVRGKISSMQSGSTRKRISRGNLATVPIPIPPVNEQRRIVEKIEAMFDEIDAGIQSLQTARTTLGLYRQSLLKSAFEGRLTADWRAQNADKLEDPKTLLDRIQSERDTRYKAALDTWQDALTEWRTAGENGKKPAKPKRPDDVSTVDPSEAREVGEVPKDWAWVRPSLIAAPSPHAIGIGPFGSNLKVSDYRDEGVPLVFVRNITNEDFSLTQKFVSPVKAAELDAHSIQAGDVLVTKMGDPPGDCTVYPDNEPYAIITADCLKFRVWEQFANRRFVSFMIRSNSVKRQLGLITQGVAQKKISVARFKTIALPLPSIAEQTEIVRILDARLEATDALEAEIDAALTRADALRQSILKKAFSGHLVAQDPNDEPASALLDRIKVEREAAPKQGRNRRAMA